MTHGAGMERRRMWNNDESDVHERQTQSSRDTLRRRQKLKKSRTVKRHVFYKQRKLLLEQLEADTQEARNEDTKDNEIREKSDEEINVDEHTGNSTSDKVDDEEKQKQKFPGRYLPFAKQRREYEEWKNEREAEERKKEEQIKRREAMLAKSRKRRKKEGKQYRKTRENGQPKLKHRMESMLAKIELGRKK